MIRQLLALGVALGMAHDPGGCGGMEPASGGVNAPCTRPKDCQDGLTCQQGVCEAADGGAAAADSGAGAAQTKDAPDDG